MDTLNVTYRLGSYKVFIDSNTIGALKEYLENNCKGKKAVVITDDTVGALYGDEIESLLSSCGLSVSIMTIEHGENSKCMTTLQNVYEHMCRENITRSDLIVALGGGVVGDLAGFAASSFMRGIPYISIPTSLLSQVDSSIGGKVAVDLPWGKNLVGAFYPPKAVFICTDFLKTLENRYLHDGLAEVIKYGCIKDPSIISSLKEVKSRDELLECMKALVVKCLLIKKELAEKDELDTGERMLLNFGHTIGHGIEKHYGYLKYTHGEAVGLGMVWITERSEELGLTAPGTSKKIADLLHAFSLPCTPDKSIREDVIHTISHDKKASGGIMHLILLKDIGEGVIKDVSMSDVDSYI